MTTLGLHTQDFDLPQFVYLNNKHAKMSAKTNVGSNKPYGSNQYNKSTNKQSYSLSNNKQYHQNNQAQDYYPAKGSNTSKYVEKNGGKQYAKWNFSGKKVQDKYYNYYASTASDSDSSSSSAQSEITAFDLMGFKIAQNGKILHDEIEEDFGSIDLDFKVGMKPNNVKFASSTMVISPNPQDISLPTFV
jgi:hypothetical protein